MSMDIKKVARVARIFLSKADEAKYQENLQSILPWFGRMFFLEELSNIAGTPVYSTVSKESNRNYFPDEIMKEESVSDVLFNTPNKKGNLILVPRVIS